MSFFGHYLIKPPIYRISRKLIEKNNIEGSIEIGLDKRRYERATLPIIEDVTGKTEKFQILKDKIPSFT